MEKKERFLQAYNYLKSKGLVHKQRDLVERMQTTPPNVSKALNGMEAFLTDKFLRRFNAAYSNIFSNDWLLFGRGEMLAPTTAITPKTGKEINIIDIHVCAGTGCGFDGDENRIIATVTIPDFAGCYGVTVYGNSMHGMYNAGDVVFVRQITDVRNIENGQPYVVITREDRLLKLVHVDYANSTITLSSYNAATLPDGRRMYPDMQLGESDVLYLYKVVGRLSRTQM